MDLLVFLSYVFKFVQTEILHISLLNIFEDAWFTLKHDLNFFSVDKYDDFGGLECT